MKKAGEYRNCLTCNIPFWVQANVLKKGKGKYCSSKCSNKGKLGQTAWWIKQGKKNLSNTGRTRFTKERVNDSEFKKKRIASMPREESHPKWKGDAVGYGGLHDWVRKNLGSPSKCGDCGEHDDKKMYHWANKSGLYLRKLSDWERLCVPCHKLKDMKKRREFAPLIAI